MNIALYNLVFEEKDIVIIKNIIQLFEEKDANISFYAPFYEKIKDEILLKNTFTLFQSTSDLKNKTDMLVSIGGDGTILHAITLIHDTGIPIVGINTGRMGFLASISKNDISEAVTSLLEKNYVLEQRSLISIKEPSNLFNNLNFALNEFSVQKDSAPSMIHLHTYVNDVFLNSYWADGLLVSTPTGSTGYSLSNGGPIMTPDSENFIITPIASHNLTVRPLIIPDNQTIRIEFRETNKNILLGLDSRSILIQKPIYIILHKAPFKINLIRMFTKSFFATINEKLMWGLDIRN